MDILREKGLYSRKCRLFFNSMREDTITWRLTSPGAPYFPGLHVFASGDYRDSRASKRRSGCTTVRYGQNACHTRSER